MQSPKLNPIELRDEIDCEMKEILTDIRLIILMRRWKQLSQQKLKKLIERMSRLIKSVLLVEDRFFDEKKV